MKRLLIAIGLAALMATGVAAQETRIVESMFGPVELPANPQRIVVETPRHLGDMIALGLKPIASGIYGESDLSYLGDAVEGIELLPFGDNGLNLERIAALQPDLIIAYGGAFGEEWGKESCALYAEIAPTYCGPLDYVTPAESGDNIRDLGKALGLEAKAEEIIAEYNARAAAVKAAAEAKGVLGTTVSVLRVLFDKYQFRFGTEGEALRAAGFTFPEGQVPSPEAWASDISLEKLDDVSTDVILISVDARAESQLEALRANPLWTTLPAVKAGRVYQVPTAVYNGSDFIAAGIRLDDVQKYMIDAAP